MKKILALAFFASTTISTAASAGTFTKGIKKPLPIDKNYINFQLYGMTIAEGDNTNQSANTSQYKSLAYTFTNLDIDFNFNKNFSVVTQTSLQNRENGFGRPYAIIDYTNGNNNINPLFDNTGLTSRVLAFNLHNKNTSLTFGKIRPRAGLANGMNLDMIHEDWYGVYGNMIDNGYANTNKLGLQFNTSFSIMPYSKQTLEVAIFKNDTTALNKPAFADLGTFGYGIPSSLSSILSQREAGNTFAPSSFSILAINQPELVDNQTLTYSAYYRKQDVNKQSGSFLSPENTFAFSGKYEKSYKDVILGLFGNAAFVNNAFGISDLNERYYTASAYVDIDSFVIVFAYNLYTMNNLTNVGNTGKDVAGANFSQGQISFGYKFNKALKVDIAYRQLTDSKTNKVAQGIGLSAKYNIGIKE